MARIITVAIGQVVSSNWQPTTGLTTVNLRLSPFAVATYTMDSPLGDGVYKFNDVILDGDYKVFVGDIEQTYFGMICLGKSGAVLITGNQTIDGVKTFTQQIVLTAGVKTNTISENTADAGITIDGVLIKDSLDASNIQSLSTAQTVTAKKTYSASNMPETTAGRTYSSPRQLVDKELLDTTFSGGSTIPMSPNTIYYLPQRTADQYSQTTLTACATFFNDSGNAPSSINRCKVFITAEEALQITPADATWLQDYVDIVAQGGQAFISLANSGTSHTNETRIYNVWLNAGTTVQSFTNYTFDSCFFNLTASNNISFISCTFKGICIIKMGSGTLTITNGKGGGIVMTNAGVSGVPSPVITGTTPAQIQSEIPTANLGTN